jgi:GNAT superfamily N-acetyltransferase
LSRRKHLVKIRGAVHADMDTLPNWLSLAGNSAGQESIDYLSESLASGLLGSALQIPPDAASRVFAERFFQANDPTGAMAARTTVQMLTLDGEVIGCGVLGPSVPFMRQLEQHDLVQAWVGLTKLHALAVDDAHRGRGNGQRLVRRILEIARSSGLFTVYGQFDYIQRPQLESFYTGCGFTVCEPAKPINAGIVFGFGRGGPLPEQGERMFYRNVQQRSGKS